MWQPKTGPIWHPKIDNIHCKYVCHVSDTSALPSEVVFLWAFSRPKPLEIEKKLPWCGLPRHPWTSPKSTYRTKLKLDKEVGGGDLTELCTITYLIAYPYA